MRFLAGAVSILTATVLSGCTPEAVDMDVGGAVETDVPLASCAPTVPSQGLRVDTLATGLEVPWDVAFLGDQRALVTERPGRIRVVSANQGLISEPWAELDVFAREEVGLMGIDIGPDSSSVFVAATHQVEPSNALASLAARVRRRVVRALDPEKGHPTTLRLLRIPVGAAGSAGDPEVILQGIPAFLLHGGGAVRVGPDGMVYLTNGDGFDPPSAQRTSSLRGKILRVLPDGSVPASNPIPSSPVWALGIRHVQGLAWDTSRETMLAIDHGPSGIPSEGGRQGRDELNVIQPGANYGWPLVAGTTARGKWTSALVSWTPAIAPAGLAVYSGPDTAWAGDAFVTALRGTSLRRLELDRQAGEVGVVCEEILLSSSYGRLRLVRSAPDGSLWVGTSNEDGRGIPREGGDMLLRVHPPGSLPIAHADPPDVTLP